MDVQLEVCTMLTVEIKSNSRLQVLRLPSCPVLTDDVVNVINLSDVDYGGVVLRRHDDWVP
jgi:hypothetical protein